jgi:hypothetical protein
VPSLLAVAFKEYTRQTARAWDAWPELFWMNVAVAAVNALSAVVIWISSPESRLVTVPVLSMSTVILVSAFIGGVVERRRMRREEQAEDDFFDY